MIIRAITGFIDPGWPVRPERIANLAHFLQDARQALIDVGYEIQTLRLATPPPSQMKTAVPVDERVEMARQLEAECFVHGIDYAAIGPALPEEPQGYTIIPDILAATENIFSSAVFASNKLGLSLAAVQACGRIIERTSHIAPEGFANLRFAALANVPAGAPFFPGSYHSNGPPAVAVALEGASAAVEAFKRAPSIRRAQQHLITAIERHTGAVDSVFRRIPSDGHHYLGVDFSLAPFPEEQRSIGTAMESTGLPAVGLSGSVTVATLLTSCIENARFTRTGFCGLLTPVLEDIVLAQRAAEGTLQISDLLLYSTVCGTGLDTIPLPGDSSEEQLSALLLDLGTLSLRHNKPLTARLMPIPGKAAGDDTEFDFAFFANSKIMHLPALPLTGVFDGHEILKISPRNT